MRTGIPKECQGTVDRGRAPAVAAPGSINDRSVAQLQTLGENDTSSRIASRLSVANSPNDLTKDVWNEDLEAVPAQGWHHRSCRSDRRLCRYRDDDPGDSGGYRDCDAVDGGNVRYDNGADRSMDASDDCARQSGLPDSRYIGGANVDPGVYADHRYQRQRRAAAHH